MTEPYNLEFLARLCEHVYGMNPAMERVQLAIVDAERVVTVERSADGASAYVATEDELKKARAGMRERDYVKRVIAGAIFQSQSQSSAGRGDAKKEAMAWADNIITLLQVSGHLLELGPRH